MTFCNKMIVLKIISHQIIIAFNYPSMGQLSKVIFFKLDSSYLS